MVTFKTSRSDSVINLDQLPSGVCILQIENVSYGVKQAISISADDMKKFAEFLNKFISTTKR